MARRVAFHSKISVLHLTNLNRNQVLVFDETITNIGNAYSPATGVFTAPEDGVYVFNVGAMSLYKTHQQLELVKDGKVIQTMHVDGTIGTCVTASLTAVLELKTRDLVFVRVGSGCGGIQGENFSFFSGWLL